MQISLAELVSRFDRGDIRLPLMQRDYVWKTRKVTALLDSLYRGWPIGSFYLWQTRDDHPTRRRGGRRAEAVPQAGPRGFLLDGQQRLTSISLAIQGEAEGDLASRAFFDLRLEEFVLGSSGSRVRTRIAKGDPTLLPLSELIASDDTMRASADSFIDRTLGALAELDFVVPDDKLAREYRHRLQRVSGMLARPALCELFVDEDEDNAFQVFARLNKGGASLQAGDVAAARLASRGTREIVEPMRMVASEPRMRALGINFLFLLRLVITVHRDNCSFSRLPQSWASEPAKVAESWRITQGALRLMVTLVEDNMGWTSRRWLPSTMALVPLVYLFAKGGTAAVSDSEMALVRRYLLITGLRSLVRGSPETTVNLFVGAVRDVRGTRLRRLRALAERIPKSRRVRLRKEELLSPSTGHSAVMQAYRAYLTSVGARSWPSGDSLQHHGADLETQTVVHSIFPKRLSVELEIPAERFNCAANYAIVLLVDAHAMSGESAFASWQRLKPSQRTTASVQLCLLDASHLLREENFTEFLEHRAGKMAEQLNAFISF